MDLSSSNSKGVAESSERNWLDVPRELVFTIFQKLGAIEILTNAQSVCSVWRNISKDPFLWRTIDMHNLGDLGDMEYDLEILCRRAIGYSSGNLVDINIEYFGNDDLLYFIANSASSLRRLRLACCYGITNKGLSKVAEMLPKLEELDISISNISKEPLEAIGRCCPQLKSIKFNMEGYKHPRVKCDEEAFAIAQTMSGLRHLQLFGNKLTNDGLLAILDGCPHLESLDLRRCFNLNFEGSLGTRCAEKVKVFRLPYDSTDDYPFKSKIVDGPSDSDMSNSDTSGSETSYSDPSDSDPSDSDMSDSDTSDSDTSISDTFVSDMSDSDTSDSDTSDSDTSVSDASVSNMSVSDTSEDDYDYYEFSGGIDTSVSDMAEDDYDHYEFSGGSEFFDYDEKVKVLWLPYDSDERNWLDLPREVVSTIFQKLDAISVWHNISMDPFLWRTINMYNLGDLGNMEYDLEILCRRAVGYSSGNLVDVNIEYFGNVDLLYFIADSARNLRRLRLACCYGITDEGLSEVAKMLSQLEELDISISNISKVSLEAIGRCCPQLKSIKFNMEGYRYPHVKSDEEAFAITETMSGLRHIQLFGNKLTSDGLLAILDGCPHLESLDLRRCFNLNLEGSLGRCAEKVRIFRLPYDSTYDYPFESKIVDGSLDEGCPSLSETEIDMSVSDMTESETDMSETDMTESNTDMRV